MNILQKVFLYYPLKTLSLLPLQALYFLTYPVYILIYYILRYRRVVTKQNLTNAFPHKSQFEIQQLEKKYYRYLSRLLAELIKGLTISESELRKRVILHDREVLQGIYDKYGASMVLLGHYGNWELIALAAELVAPHHFCIVYKPIHNSFVNQLMNKTRKRFGADTLPMEFTYSTIKNSQSDKTLFTLVADQSPSNLKSAQWVKFLNQDTAFMSGADLLNKRLNIPVCYLHVKSSKSGFYELYPKVIIESNNSDQGSNLIKQYAELLEADITQKPEMWLWSHKRWKHKPANN